MYTVQSVVSLKMSLSSINYNSAPLLLRNRRTVFGCRAKTGNSCEECSFQLNVKHIAFLLIFQQLC